MPFLAVLTYVAIRCSALLWRYQVLCVIDMMPAEAATISALHGGFVGFVPSTAVSWVPIRIDHRMNQIQLTKPLPNVSALAFPPQQARRESSGALPIKALIARSC